MKDIREKLRTIPAIDRLLAIANSQPDLAGLPHSQIVQALRYTADMLRCRVMENQATDISLDTILECTRARLREVAEPSLKRVVNATGVVLHTNLGRAPLSQRAQKRIADVVAGYCTLEYEVASGERGSRYSHVAEKICALTGAEAALVVNNNAAAVLLVLSALACGREVIVSRGQLVEIGGSFRVPDVLKQSGACLVEVGTTNKTHLRDYEQAIGSNTAVILKVHTSNYRIVGFTAQPEEAALVEMARRHNLPVIEDLGSGTLLPVAAGGWQEPTVSEKLAAGIDIVTFSGDKLFGGAQAGIIAGKRTYIEQMKKHPLLRAIRIDKLSLAAIEGTLLDYAVGNPQEDIPVQRMLNLTLPELEQRALNLADDLGRLEDWEVRVIRLQSQAGGGALPAIDLDSWGVSLRPACLSTVALEKQLRQQTTPIVVRVQDDRIIVDVRCLSDGDMTEICEACAKIGKGAKA